MTGYKINNETIDIYKDESGYKVFYKGKQNGRHVVLLCGYYDHDIAPHYFTRPYEKRMNEFCGRPHWGMSRKNQNTHKFKVVGAERPDWEKARVEEERVAKISASRKASNLANPEREKATALKISKTVQALQDSGHYDNVDYSKSPETRAKISAGLIQSYKDGIAKPTYFHNAGIYQNNDLSIRMRSGSEILFAQKLDAAGVKWEYEPKRFDLGWCTYLPDFYLPELKTYVEVKGFMFPQSQKKVDQFMIDNPLVIVWSRDIFSDKDILEVISSGTK